MDRQMTGQARDADETKTIQQGTQQRIWTDR